MNLTAIYECPAGMVCSNDNNNNNNNNVCIVRPGPPGPIVFDCPRTMVDVPFDPTSACIKYNTTGRIAHPRNTTKYVNCFIKNKALVGLVYDCVPSGSPFTSMTRWCTPKPTT